MSLLWGTPVHSQSQHEVDLTEGERKKIRDGHVQMVGRCKRPKHDEDREPSLGAQKPGSEKLLMSLNIVWQGPYLASEEPRSVELDDINGGVNRKGKFLGRWAGQAEERWRREHVYLKTGLPYFFRYVPLCLRFKIVLKPTLHVSFSDLLLLIQPGWVTLTE